LSGKPDPCPWRVDLCPPSMPVLEIPGGGFEIVKTVGLLAPNTR